jgi:uncharacterized phage infection (PIP) family protein YhgE
MEIREVIGRTSEVASSIEELNQGSNQVMEAMNELQDYTNKVKESTMDISENIHSVKRSVSEASEISQQVSSGSEEIRTGMTVIRESSERTRSVADSIKTISLDLDMAVSQFQIEEGSDASGENDVVPELPEEDDHPSIVVEDGNSVTLSEGDWPGKDELTVVDSEGQSEIL